MASSLRIALQRPFTANSVISTITDEKTQSHDSRSSAAKELEFQLGYIIENYIANGKDRFNQYVDEHWKLCQEFIQKDGRKRGNSHKMKEIKVQNRVWLLLAHLCKSKEPKTTNKTIDDYYFCPRSFITDKFNGDYKLRKLEHVILWLEDIASTPYFIAKGDISYSRTLSQSKHHRHPSLNCLDPDVMTRMAIDINSLSKEEMDDFNDEEKLLHCVFMLIRKGNWNEAVL